MTRRVGIACLAALTAAGYAILLVTVARGAPQPPPAAVAPPAVSVADRFLARLAAGDNPGACRLVLPELHGECAAVLGATRWPPSKRACAITDTDPEYGQVAIVFTAGPAGPGAVEVASRKGRWYVARAQAMPGNLCPEKPRPAPKPVPKTAS